MDRYWLITWTTYGTWLPGDKRGFVSPVLNDDGDEVIYNTPNTRYDSNIPALREFAIGQLKGPPIQLDRQQANRIFEQFIETTEYRGWSMCAAAIMKTHVHIVVGVPNDPDPSSIMGAYKSYASRRLNGCWDKPPSGTWWTESGSKRKLPNEAAVIAAVRYVEQQAKPLLIWIAEGYRRGSE